MAENEFAPTHVRISTRKQVQLFFGTVLDEETGKPFAVFRRKNGSLWSRPLDRFLREYYPLLQPELSPIRRKAK